nr:hypothetical protein [Komagataeibacter saccharivorans]
MTRCSAFRRSNRMPIKAVFVHVLLQVRETGLVRLWPDQYSSK